VDARLKEVGFGEWEGKSLPRSSRCARHAGALKADPDNARPAGAEPLPFSMPACRRARELLTQLPATRAAGGHAGVIACAGVALHIPLEHAYRIEVASAGMTPLRFDGEHAT